MTEHERNQGIIPADRVKRVQQPVMVDCGTVGPDGEQGALSVVPLMDGERIAGLEIHCRCGAAAVVECVYPSEDAE